VSDSASLDLSRLTLLLSHDRSGSHYLGSIIRALPRHRMVDEVCNEQAVDPVSNPLSFFGYRHKHSTEHPDYALRRRPDVVRSLLDAYFSFVLAQSEGKSVAIDIKYGHVHNFEIAWWPVFRKPFLLEYAQSRRLKMIHLSRWNSLETVISGEVAESRKLWHAIADKPQASEADAIEVDCRRVLEQITLLNQQKDAFYAWTRGVNCLSVLYEELSGPAAGPATRVRLARFLEAEPPAAFASPYKKVTPPLHRIVKNWEELTKVCRENALGHYILPISD
jgi:hypothetical protein